MEKRDIDNILDLANISNIFTVHSFHAAMELANWYKNLSKIKIETLLYEINKSLDLNLINLELEASYKYILENWREYEFILEAPYNNQHFIERDLLSHYSFLLNEEETQLSEIQQKLVYYSVFEPTKEEELMRMIAEKEESIHRIKALIYKEESFIEDDNYRTSLPQGTVEKTATSLASAINEICMLIKHMDIPKTIDFKPLAYHLSKICANGPFMLKTIDEDVMIQILSLSNIIYPVNIKARRKSWVLAMIYAIAAPVDKNDVPYIKDTKSSTKWKSEAIKYFGLEETEKKHSNDLLIRNQENKSTDKPNRIYDFYMSIREVINIIQEEGA